MKVLARLQDLQKEAVSGFEEKQLSLIPKAQLSLAAAYKPTLFSRIELHHFYGIELDDFAHEIAALSLWLAEHQMNLRFKEAMGEALPSLPLKAGGNIVHGNATRLNWEEVCPKGEGLEIYILGNPPYEGSSKQLNSQKNDMSNVFKGVDDYKNLDYIACWFYKASVYIKESTSQFAFVTTNSICQGEQVEMLWPKIFGKDLEIGFCVSSFKWTNNAKNKAAVYCVIIGIRNQSVNPKFFYKHNLKITVGNINPYLIPNVSNIIIVKRQKPLSLLPEMTYGNKPTDGGHLLLSEEEKHSLPEQAKRFIKKIVGAKEFMDKIDRWCIWIDDDQAGEAIAIPDLANRINSVRNMRLASPKVPTQKLADYPYKFGEIRHKQMSAIVVPRHGSDRREYLPFGYVSSDTIISDAAQAIYSDEAWIFGVISTKMHLAWIKISCGKIKEDPRYSSSLGYNTFPFPPINQIQKEVLGNHVFQVLAEREKHSEKTFAYLYSDKMPQGLQEAHRQLDIAVEHCYRPKPFESDEERLEYLFKLYEKMIAEEKAKEAATIEPKKQKINTP